MALILEFPISKCPAADYAAPPDVALRGECAQILFFTGVRYERSEGVGRKVPRRPRRRRPRRTKSA